MPRVNKTTNGTVNFQQYKNSPTRTYTTVQITGTPMIDAANWEPIHVPSPSNSERDCMNKDMTNAADASVADKQAAK